MANEKNLIPFDQMSEKERKQKASNGGRKSGETKRQRKAMREQAELLLSLPFNQKDRNGSELKKILSDVFGIKEDLIDNQMAMIIALWKTALGNGKNQISAFQELRKLVQDEYISDNDEKVQIINDLPKDGEYDEES